MIRDTNSVLSTVSYPSNVVAGGIVLCRSSGGKVMMRYPVDGSSEKLMCYVLAWGGVWRDQDVLSSFILNAIICFSAKLRRILWCEKHLRLYNIYIAVEVGQSDSLT